MRHHWKQNGPGPALPTLYQPEASPMVRANPWRGWGMPTSSVPRKSICDAEHRLVSTGPVNPLQYLQLLLHDMTPGVMLVLPKRDAQED